MSAAAHPMVARLAAARFAPATGRVRTIRSGHFVADGPLSTVGDVCTVESVDGGEISAEVAAVNEDRIVLVPFESQATVKANAEVRAGTRRGHVGVGDAYGGRALDALGRPIDGRGPIAADRTAPISGRVPDPLDRVDPTRSLPTGLRAIDAMLTVGVGQRVGIFAASGVGKTSLVEQLAGQVECDRLVICLVGERGREVERFWRAASGSGDGRSATLVAATSDESAAMRVRAVRYAAALAEHWRDAGEHVVLIVDSITRMAMALREIGLAAGEPPTVRAYTPNIFSAIPRIVERCGATAGGGAITAFITVLAETDDIDDPIAELMRSLLDGHIVLSRRLAELSHFPAIDVSRSVSRNADRIRSGNHVAAARALGAMLGTYEEARAMIESGLYKPGASAAIDRAIAGRADALAFLRQDGDEASAFDTTVARLGTLSNEARGHG